MSRLASKQRNAASYLKLPIRVCGLLPLRPQVRVRKMACHNGLAFGKDKAQDRGAAKHRASNNSMKRPAGQQNTAVRDNQKSKRHKSAGGEQQQQQQQHSVVAPQQQQSAPQHHQQLAQPQADLTVWKESTAGDAKHGSEQAAAGKRTTGSEHTAEADTGAPRKMLTAGGVKKKTKRASKHKKSKNGKKRSKHKK
eukprot:jgi/Chrzof1/11574/Cz06g00220.t1